MKCREFKSNHVGFIDDVLPAADMSDMRRHVATCPECAAHDTRIRRSLLVVRNIAQIEPSADFFDRLSEALKQAPPSRPNRRPIATIAAVTAFTAALAAALYFAMVVSPRTPERPVAPMTAQTRTAEVSPVPMNEVAIAATVPAGVPVWPAMFMIGELPTHLVTTKMLDSTSSGQ